MQVARKLTFENDGLSRAAHLRDDDAAIAALKVDPTTRAIVIWRGRPLLAGGDDPRLERLAMDHPLLALDRAPPVFLGLGPNGALFGHDISEWEPDTPPAEGPGIFDDQEFPHPDLPAGNRFADLRMVMGALPALDAGLAATTKAILGWHDTHGFCARCGKATGVSMAGWQRQCPACGTRHFPRTDPVVIMLVTRANSVLIGRSPGWPEGMMSLLAGFVEPGETIETAVRREVKEECDIDIGAVSYLTSQPWPFPASLMIGCAARALSDKITIDPVEIEAARWVSREDMLAVFAGQDRSMIPARLGSVAHFLLQSWLADNLP